MNKNKIMLIQNLVLIFSILFVVCHTFQQGYMAIWVSEVPLGPLQHAKISYNPIFIEFKKSFLICDSSLKDTQ